MAEGGSSLSDEPATIRLAEGEDLEEQINECIALQSIYEHEDIEICPHDNAHGDLPGGILNIPIYPPQPFEVKITKDMPGIRKLAFASVRGRGRKRVLQETKTNNATSSATEKLYPIKRLLPITLTFAFPHDYPSINPPIFTLSCCWLEKMHLSRLCLKLDQIWKSCPGTAIVMNWINFIQEETLAFLKIESPYDLGRVLVHVFTHPTTGPNTETVSSKYSSRSFDPRGFQTHGSIEDLLPKVLDFDLTTCEVCFEEQSGEQFLRLVNCSDHQLCKECMRGWFEGKIGEGAVNDIKCPGYKCDKAVLPTEVASIVSPEVYQRYEQLQLKTAFDIMRDVINCPRQFCQFPVVLEDNLGVCQKCQHAFCGRCQNTYHGHTPCKLKLEMYSELCAEYENCSSSRRKELELHYGKATIKRALEEVRSNRWLESNSKQCPNCSTFIQKKDGCNKMTCSNCHTFFCWLCQAELSRSNPYAHYQHPTSACTNRLFEGVEITEDNIFDDFVDEFWWIEEEDDDVGEDSVEDDIEFI